MKKRVYRMKHKAHNVPVVERKEEDSTNTSKILKVAKKGVKKALGKSEE